jgi:hypothetical protein
MNKTVLSTKNMSVVVVGKLRKIQCLQLNVGSNTKTAASIQTTGPRKIKGFIMTIDLEKEDVVVYLNDKMLITATHANAEEGWVDMLDFEAVAPSCTEDLVGSDEPAEVPTKRVFGKVEIISLSELQSKYLAHF